MECLEAEGFGKALGSSLVDRTRRQGETVSGQQQAQHTRGVELCVAVLNRHAVAKADEVDKEFGTDKTYRAENADGRKVGHSAQTVLFKAYKGH